MWQAQQFNCVRVCVCEQIKSAAAMPTTLSLSLTSLLAARCSVMRYAQGAPHFCLFLLRLALAMSLARTTRERERERDNNNNNGCAAQQADINQDFRSPEPQMFLKGFTAATTTSGGRLGSLSPGIADNLMHA